MSEYNALQALRTILQSSNVVPAGDTSYIDPPEAFDPSGKSLWVDEAFMPATSESTGKTKASSDEDRGVYQIAVYAPLMSRDYGAAVSAAVKTIKSAFYYGASEVYNGTKVDILEVTAQGQVEDEAWVRRIISVNYLNYIPRG